VKKPTYPYEQRGVRASITPRDFHRLMWLETSAGRPRRHPTVPAAFLKRHKASSTVGAPIANYAPSKWIRKMIHDGSSAEQLLTMVRDRVVRAPAGLAPREAIMLANELARTREGAALIRAGLTSQQIRRTFGRGPQR
jgi:hypothetical protein